MYKDQIFYKKIYSQQYLEVNQMKLKFKKYLKITEYFVS